MPVYQRINERLWILCLRFAHLIPVSVLPAIESPVTEWILWKKLATYAS